jgi:VWFA-related protein
MAQQSPAPAGSKAAKPGSAQNSPAAQQDAPAQSFTVQPGTLDDEQPMAVIHTTTRRVVVDVVVTGADGKPVEGLTQQDFTVLEDRKPQSVRAFDVHTPEEDRNLLPPAPLDLPSHTFLNLEQTPASGPPVLILIDYLNTPLDSQAYAHEQIVQFIQRKPASTEVAIFTLTDDLSLLQGFTTDTNRLLTAMKSRAAGMHMTSASEHVMKAQITLDAFLDLGRFLTTMNGRKNLLWFSGSFDMMILPKAQDVEEGLIAVNETGRSNQASGPMGSSPNSIQSQATMSGLQDISSDFRNEMGDITVLQDRMRKVAAALAVSQTAVYPIDARTGSPNLAAVSTAPVGTPGMPTGKVNPPASVQSHNDFMQSLDASHATMQEIAEATGGHAFFNSNGIALAAGKAISEGSAYYTLVYAPSNLNFDGELRTIHVKLDKPGCKLSYRSAYYAVDPATVTPEDAESGALAGLMVRGAPDAQGLVFKTMIDPEGPPKMAAQDSPLANKAVYHPVKKSKKPQHLSGMVQAYNIRLAILTQPMQLTATPDGRHHAALEIAVYAYAADGQKLGGTKQNLEASMPAAVYQDAMRNGMFHTLHVDLPVEAASLRLAVLDPGNHHAGSLEVPLPLPPTQQAGAASSPASPGSVAK